MKKALALVAASMIVLTGSAEASDVRLDGHFKVIGSIVSSSDGSAGSVVARDYGFTALCPRGACQRVILKREGPHGSHFRSILHKRKGGYAGKEKRRVPCDHGGHGNQIVKLRIRPTRPQDGVATELRGAAKFKQECASGDFSQKVKLFGERG